VDPLRRSPLERIKEVAKELDDRAADARSKARAASHANVHFKHGETSFAAGAGADAGAGAEAATGGEADASAAHGGPAPEQALAQLERLNALHASGGVSDEEYESLKKRLLEAAS
jgi:Short C-terminal domain